VDLNFIGECVAKWENKTSEASIFVGDQADEAFLRTFLIESSGNFDIIIDDGGHTMKQQKTSLELLWDSIKTGGVYFIEDLDTSCRSEFGGGLGILGTFMEDIKDMLDDMNSTWAVRTSTDLQGCGATWVHLRVCGFDKSYWRARAQSERLSKRR
jgi:hypothetical protein